MRAHTWNAQHVALKRNVEWRTYLDVLNGLDGTFDRCNWIFMCEKLYVPACKKLGRTASIKINCQLNRQAATWTMLHVNTCSMVLQVGATNRFNNVPSLGIMLQILGIFEKLRRSFTSIVRPSTYIWFFFLFEKVGQHTSHAATLWR